MVKVLLTDDHSIVRLGTSIAVKEALPDVVIDQAGDFSQMMELLNAEPYDLLVLDINMPGGNNVQMVEKIYEVQPALKILVFSSYEESIYALRYLEAGVHGYVHKNMPKADLIDAVKQVTRGRKFMTPKVSELYYQALLREKSNSQEENPIGSLSNRELDVAQHLIKGKSIAEISKELNLKSSTVSTYKTRLFEKLNVENLPELIQLFHLQDIEL